MDLHRRRLLELWLHVHLGDQLHEIANKILVAIGQQSGQGAGTGNRRGSDGLIDASESGTVHQSLAFHRRCDLLCGLALFPLSRPKGHTRGCGIRDLGWHGHRADSDHQRRRVPHEPGPVGDCGNDHDRRRCADHEPAFSQRIPLSRRAS